MKKSAPTKKYGLLIRIENNRKPKWFIHSLKSINSIVNIRVSMRDASEMKKRK